MSETETSIFSNDDTSRDAITVRSLKQHVRTRVLGRNFEAIDACDSTNAVARRMLEQGDPPPNGTLIVSDYQDSGRGRQGAKWNAPPGTALLFSLILYPAPMQRAGMELPGSEQLVTMALALGVTEALREQGTAPCSIKWPNDVLDARRRKICGILTESVKRRGHKLPAMIAGAGVNVHQDLTDFPGELRDTAVSADMISSRPVHRLRLLASILELTEEWLGRENDELFDAWRERCSTIGLRVRVKMHSGSPLQATAMGIAPDGALRLRLDSGSIRTVRAGEVEEIRPE